MRFFPGFPLSLFAFLHQAGILSLLPFNQLLALKAGANV